jgi:hypothetical protein
MQYEKPVLSQREIPPEALDWFFTMLVVLLASSNQC